MKPWHWLLAWVGLTTAYAAGQLLAWLLQDFAACFPFIPLWAIAMVAQ